MKSRLEKGEEYAGQFYKYFYNDDDGNLYIDPEFRKEIKNIRGNKLVNLIRHMFWKSGDNLEEYIDATRGLAGGVSGTYEQRKRFIKPRKIFLERANKNNLMFCAVCGTKENLTVDHIVPLAKGGSNEQDNFQILCASCNSKKGAK